MCNCRLSTLPKSERLQIEHTGGVGEDVNGTSGELNRGAGRSDEGLLESLSAGRGRKPFSTGVSESLALSDLLFVGELEVR